MVGNTSAFWDSSALVPLCTRQSNSDDTLRLASHYTIVTWWGSSVEIHSAIARLHRLGVIDQADLRIANDRLNLLSMRWREIQPGEEVRTEASNVLYAYPLRAADSLQLAAAMVWCSGKTSGRSFICSDTRLGQAATLAGFTLLKPEAVIFR